MKNGSYKKIGIKSLIILLSQTSNMTINCTKAIYTSISTKILKVWLSDPEVLPQIPDVICSCGIEFSELSSNTRVTYDECAEHTDETSYIIKIGKHKSLLAARLRKQTRDTTDRRWKPPFQRSKLRLHTLPNI